MAFDSPAFSDPFALLSKSVRVGRPFGIEVRVYVTALLVVLVGTSQFRDWPGVSFPLALALSLGSAILLYAGVFLHELGHAFVGRRYGVQTPTITMSAFGGLAHMSAGAPNPSAEIKIALGGPATELLWIAIAWPLSRIVAPVPIGEFGLPFDVFDWLMRLHIAFLCFNLLPAFPMDGGRALRGALATRMHPNRATLIACRIGIVVAIGIAAWGLRTGGFYGGLLVVIALNNVLACVREMAAARHTDGPYAPVDPWSSSGEEWKQGVAPARHAKIAAEVLGNPPVRHRPVTAVRTAGDDEELDALLDRVSAVGIAGLTEAERRRLTQLSCARHNRS